MQAEGYSVIDGNPWEDASGGKADACNVAAGCTLTTKVHETPGLYSVVVQYFDLRSGVSSYELLLNGKSVAAWKADATLPPAVNDKRIGGQTSTRYTSPPLEIHSGDTLTLRGIPDGGEQAPVDYFELMPSSQTRTPTGLKP